MPAVLRCPACLYPMDTFDAASHIQRGPQDDDRTICWQCQAMLIFEGGAFGLRLRRMTDDEVKATLAEHGDAFRLIQSVKQNGGQPESVLELWLKLHPPKDT